MEHDIVSAIWTHQTIIPAHRHFLTEAFPNVVFAMGIVTCHQAYNGMMKNLHIPGCYCNLVKRTFSLH